MVRRMVHYELAFEHYLRANRTPYVAVDEARRALLPPDADLKGLKSFDFVVYGPDLNLLVDVKGRMFGRTADLGKDGRERGGTRRAFDSWVTRDDVESLGRWQTLFGAGFEATFVFIYCLRRQPPDVLFEEVFAHGPWWYALREVRLDDYRRRMVPRSSKWGTVHLRADDWAAVSRPFTTRSGRWVRSSGDG